MNAELEKWVNENACPAMVFDNDVRCVSVAALDALFDGKVLVSVEPTREMCKAATSYTHSHDAKLIYKAMLAASQEQGK